MESSTTARVLVVADKTAATPALIEAVRARAEAGPAHFVLLVPNPDRLPFDRIGRDITHAEQIIALATPLLEEAAGSEVEGRAYYSSDAFDDIEAELNAAQYDEIILSTLPHHVSHWLHIDLPARVGHLGYPVTTVTAEAGRQVAA